MNRWAICEAAYLYGVLWDSGRAYSSRLHAIRFRPGMGLTLERAEPETKEAYGREVRRHEWSTVAALRLCRRARMRWPGTRGHGSARLLVQGLFGLTSGQAFDAMLAVMGK